MPTYAELTDNIITNRVICHDDDHVALMSWVGPLDDLDPEPQIGWSYDPDSDTWTPPEPIEPPPPLTATTTNYPAWVQPTTSTNDYMKDDRVSYNGHDWISMEVNNMAEPGTSSAWEELTY